MKQETCKGPEEGSRGSGKASGGSQPESVMESHESQEEPGRWMQQHWEAQWQQFLRTPQALHSAWGSPQLSQAAPWDDAKAFFASFEQVADACQWPRGEWVARLLPALSGDVQQAFGLLAARDKEDYCKVKAAILRGDALRREMRRQHFRQFCCQELGDPRRMYSQLQELCCQWLKPERHTKEQILELLILEQFLASLPEDVQNWIRAGGPDSGAQAVALLEGFLMNQREADMGTWQEPLQEWAVAPLDVKEEPLDVVQEEISKERAERFRGTKPNIDGEVAMSGPGIARPTWLLPPEDQDKAESELNKTRGIPVEQVMKPRKMGVPLHMVAQTLMQSNQQTTFWKVLQESSENADSQEESLGPMLGLAPSSVKKEEMFHPDPVQSLRLSTQESDDGMRTQVSVNNSQLEGNEPVGTPRRRQGRTREKVPVTALVKQERCEVNRGQRLEPLMGCQESDELTGGLGAACSDASPVVTEGQKASFFKYDRRYQFLVPSKTGLIFEHTVEEGNDSPSLGEEIQPISKLDKHHSNHIEEKNQNCPEFGPTLHSKSFGKLQVIHTTEKTYRCSNCGKDFSQHSDLLRHKMIHTGKKPHQCPECGKNFSYKSTLLTHQMIHTGKKAHQCSVCGKTFSQRSTLIIHQNTHTGEKYHKCPTCGKGFAHRSSMLTHQMSHKGEKPYKCHTCGKSFSRRSYLSRHQKLHTGVKPHRCPNCGKSFSRRPYLLSHLLIHTGEKPHQCHECGKSFSRRSYFLTHQKLHTGQNPHQCPDCGKSFCQRSDLVRHQKTHIERNLTSVLCVR